MPRRQPDLSRRRFLGQSAALAAGALLAAPAIVRGRNLNEKLNIAVIGTGGRGGSNLRSVGSENIVALCDVYEPNLAKAAQLLPDARKFSDFRKLYNHAKEFDAVVVSTCEHTHAFATLPALQLGKHVYCEKPLTHGIWEARVIREAAAKAKVATQMGTQIHAEDNYRRVVELIQTGAIGPVREAHVWVGRVWGWQATEEEAKKNHDIVFTNERPTGSSPIPSGLDWDLWLGPAPERPFHDVYFPGPKWYRWWDFGSGTMSDLGSHWNDLPFWALKLQAPLTIEGSGPPVHPEIAPASMQSTYEYGPRGDMPAVKLTWYQGVNKPAIWTEGKIPKWDSGVLFVGDKGMLLSDYGKHVLLPEKDFAGFKRPEPFIPKSLGHHAEWIHACKTGEPTTCNFEYAGWLTEANHLGSVAYRLGKKLEWDAENLSAKNCPEAAPLVKREYRKGWKLA
jgi:predicted dehydrogenase